MAMPCPGCGSSLFFPHFGCARCDGLPPSPGFSSREILEDARRALAAVEERRRNGEDVGEWARRLAADVAELNDG